MDQDEKARLLSECTASQQGMHDAKQRRDAAIREAWKTSITGREIAEATGLSESMVGRIAKGLR